jgi:hypothetical protein
VTAVTAPVRRLLLGQQQTGRLRKLRAAVVAFTRPARPVIANLASMPGTLAAAGCFDAAAFLHSPIAGLIVTGVSCMWLEHVAADEK